MQADAPRFVKWFTDREVTRNLQRGRISLSDERAWIRNLPKHQVTDRVFAIEVDGIHIGSTGLHRINRKNRSAGFGIMIGEKSYWNRGYGTDATRTVLKYAFDRLKLHRVQLEVYDLNPRGLYVYERCGFRLEGTRRHALWREGAWHDIHVMGILRSEWTRKN